jgi:DNA-binding HxlR family transcriptional regulator
MPSRAAGENLSRNYSAWKEQSIRQDVCPVRDVMDHIGNKWSTHVIINLSQHPLRFGELKKAIPNISQRVLSQTLRDLERDGLISRVVYPTSPPSVEYSLTALGVSLLVPLWELVSWANENHGAILNARKYFVCMRK